MLTLSKLAPTAIVTAQLNLNSTQLNSSWSDYIIPLLPTTHPPQTFKALPGNLGSWFLVCNFILTQLDEICKKKYWGAIRKNI